MPPEILLLLQNQKNNRAKRLLVALLVLAIFCAVSMWVYYVFYIVPKQSHYQLVFNKTQQAPEMLKTLADRCAHFAILKCQNITETDSTILVKIRDESFIRMNLSQAQLLQDYQSGLKYKALNGTEIYLKKWLSTDTLFDTNFTASAMSYRIQHNYTEPNYTISAHLNEIEIKKISEDVFHVYLTVNAQGQEIVSEFTKATLNTQVGVLMDDSLLMLPTVKDHITEGVVVVPFYANFNDVGNLVEALNSRKNKIELVPTSIQILK